MHTLLIFCALCIISGIILLAALKRITLKLLGLGFLGIGIMSAAFYLNLRSYTVFTYEELIAKVKVEKVRGQQYDMALKFTPVERGRMRDEDTYLLKGNQWMIDADILKWKPALNMLGFNTMYKITRISGRYLSEINQQRPGQTLYTVHGGTDGFWLFLHKYQKLFPFVEAVYGNGAYAFAEGNRQCGLYVTTSGLIIKELK